MSSDLIQTPTNLFQNMLLQHVCFLSLETSSTFFPVPKKVVNKTHIHLNHVKISLLRIPKRHREKGEKHELGLMGLLCFNLE